VLAAARVVLGQLVWLGTHTVAGWDACQLVHSEIHLLYFLGKAPSVPSWAVVGFCPSWANESTVLRLADGAGHTVAPST
jgi:hypothetical protein